MGDEQETGGPTEPFLAHLGREVRRRRHEAGLTMQQLAVAASVSPRMLSQIELGQANPSLVTVGKLARALGTDFASLARQTRPHALVVHASGTVPSIWSSPAGSHAVLQVATTQRPTAELWDWTLMPGDAYRAEPDPPGSEEIFLVVSGAMTLTVDGMADIVLEAGASARLATDRSYGYANTGDVPVRFVRVAQVSG